MRTDFKRLLILALASAVLQTAATHAGLRNQLAGSPSPYLAMHAGDPTAWQGWSKQAVDQARRQNKLLFVSVGYFSCHWCHVMQRESYQDKDIAAYINQHFIPVKVDRETEPALDAHLIAFADRSQGYSGWPLNVFLTPEGYPLYATVYLPPKDFLALLQKLQALWATNAAELSRLAAAGQGGGNGPGEPVSQRTLAAKMLPQLDTLALQLGSPMTGGFGEANKFPYAPQLEFLLDRVATGSDKSLKDFLGLTLDNMARYGLRDHLQGGFFRYTVDPGWKTPHFEKMLYDNAQLASVYMKAARVFNNSYYRKVARSTLDFMQTEMLDDRGAMIASLSAIDDKNVEGGYYLWDKQELQQLLTPQEWTVYELYAGMGDPSPLEEGYLPMQIVAVDQVASRLRMSRRRAQSLIDTSKRKMLRQRSKRILPRDGKLLAGWNGLALVAFSQGAVEFPGTGYRRTANRIRDYLANTLWDGRQLYRARDNGQPLGQASLQDYASVARGLLAWARLTGKREDYQLARLVTEQAWARFYGNQGWRLSEPGFIPMEAPVDVLADDHLPSPSAAVIDTSMQLAEQLQDEKLRRRALSALNSGQQLIGADPFWYVTHINVMGKS